MLGMNFFDIFNHPNFMQPTDTLGGGQIYSPQSIPPTAIYGAFFPGQPAGRVGQLHARIIF